MGHRSHVGKAQFAELNWLPVESRVIMSRLTMTHKMLYGKVPNYLLGLITKMKDTYTVYTHGSISDLCPYAFKTMLGEKKHLPI